jgi:hypothetical protein
MAIAALQGIGKLLQKTVQSAATKAAPVQSKQPIQQSAPKGQAEMSYSSNPFANIVKTAHAAPVQKKTSKAEQIEAAKKLLAKSKLPKPVPADQFNTPTSDYDISGKRITPLKAGEKESSFNKIIAEYSQDYGLDAKEADMLSRYKKASESGDSKEVDKWGKILTDSMAYRLNGGIRPDAEIARFGHSLAGSAVKDTGNVLKVLSDVNNAVNPLQWGVNAAMKVGGASQEKIDESRKAISDPLIKTGQGIIDKGTEVSRIAPESFSGGAGELATLLIGSGKITKPLYKAVDLASDTASKINKGISLGNALRASRVAKSGGIASGGMAGDIAETVLDKGQKFLSKYLPSAAKGAADATAITSMTEGRLPNPAELAIGAAGRNVMDYLGTAMKTGAVNKYNKSINLYGTKGREESLGLIKNKTQEAIDLGLVGGKNPAEYAEGAEKIIRDFSAEAEKIMTKKNVQLGDDFYSQMSNKIDDVYGATGTGNFDKANKMKELLGELSGKSWGQKAEKIVKELEHFKEQVELNRKGLEKFAAAKGAAEPSMLATKKAALYSNETKVKQLAEKLAETQKRAAASVKPTDLFSLRKFKQIAADINEKLVSGKSSSSISDTALEDFWALVRDESEKYLTSKAPETKNLFNKMNTAYRVQEVAEKLMANPLKPTMDKGTRFVRDRYRLGQTLTDPAIQRAVTQSTLRNFTPAMEAVQSTVKNGIGGLQSLLGGKKEKLSKEEQLKAAKALLESKRKK